MSDPTTPVDPAPGEVVAPVVPPVETAPAEVDVKFDLKLPNGVELDEATQTEFKGILSDKELSASARAQKIVDLAIKREVGRVEAHEARVAGWVAEVKADKELGGDKLEATLATAKQALTLGPPELSDFLAASGLGNHPAMIRWAHAVGKALSEDTFKAGRPPVPTSSRESRLYPTTG